MAKINFEKKELAAFRIVNRCSFISEKWEQEWMLNAIRSAFRWAEQHSACIDPDSPFSIVRARREDLSAN